jgi:hypothetical protein
MLGGNARRKREAPTAPTHAAGCIRWNHLAEHRGRMVNWEGRGGVVPLLGGEEEEGELIYTGAEGCKHHAREEGRMKMDTLYTHTRTSGT